MVGASVGAGLVLVASAVVGHFHSPPNAEASDTNRRDSFKLDNIFTVCGASSDQDTTEDIQPLNISARSKSRNMQEAGKLNFAHHFVMINCCPTSSITTCRAILRAKSKPAARGWANSTQHAVVVSLGDTTLTFYLADIYHISCNVS